jgi:hypothetical protein
LLSDKHKHKKHFKVQSAFCFKPKNKQKRLFATNWSSRSWDAVCEKTSFFPEESTKKSKTVFELTVWMKKILRDLFELTVWKSLSYSGLKIVLLVGKDW